MIEDAQLLLDEARKMTLPEQWGREDRERFEDIVYVIATSHKCYQSVMFDSHSKRWLVTLGRKISLVELNNGTTRP